MSTPTATAPTYAGTSPFASARGLVVLCVLLFLGVYITVGAYRYGEIRTDADLRLNRALRVASEHALRVLDTNEVLIARVLDALEDDSDATLRARALTLHAQLRDMTAHKPQISSLWVLDAQGRPIASSLPGPVPAMAQETERSGLLWHEAHRGGLHVSGPLRAPATEAPTIQISRGRYRTDGRFAGMVSVHLRPAYFEQFHDDLVADEPGVAINLLRADGTILSRWPVLANSPAQLSANSPVMSMIRAGHANGSTVGVSSVDGRERLLNFSRLGTHPLYLGTGMDLGNMRDRWLAEMGWLAAFGLPPLLGLLFALRMAFRRGREAIHAAERLRQETEALRRVEEALLQAQKLEALGRLTGGVAHDFNNALMVISNNLYILQHRLPEGTHQPQLASIGRAVASSTKLTRQLLAFSRRQALVPEHCRLQERLPAMRDLLSPVLGSQIPLSITVDEDTAPIFVDPSEFELALINLAVNARDAQPGGGSFRIHGRNAGDARPPLLEGPLVVVECTDDGVGVPAEHLDKVFEPFFTTKEVGQGTGLGLSQVYGLCRRAGGVATLHSAPGLGTTVRLYLPPATVAPPPATQADAALPRQSGQTVLLVEDNVEVSAALRPVLESLGCTVSLAPHAAAARAWLQQQPTPPDWLLTDIVMPGDMDGVALARHVRAHYPQVRALLMSGYTDQLDAVAQLGFDILPKPCSAEVLAQAMARPLRAPDLHATTNLRRT